MENLPMDETDILGICKCAEKYSIEPHGDVYALYLGRCGHRHGYNLCHLSDFDNQGEMTRIAIVQALNEARGFKIE